MNENSNSKKSCTTEQRQKEEISFTQLEVQCVMQFMQNKTLGNIGVTLGLSQNTVHFYLMNAAQKLRFRRKNKNNL